MNALANGKITDRTPFNSTYIYGPAGDSGGAVGAALFLYHNILGHKKNNQFARLDIGNEYSDKDIGNVLTQYGSKITYSTMQKDELLGRTSESLEGGKIIGWFQGRMEFGPRALGNRSILASPLKRGMKERVNVVKKRETGG